MVLIRIHLHIGWAPERWQREKNPIDAPTGNGTSVV